MIISVLKEIKKDEGRVAATPSAVRELCAHGHTVLVERDAGLLSGFSNEQYAAAGAELVDAKDAYERADMVYKVKEILPEEYRYMRKDLIVFTYIHSNGSREQTDVCLEAGVTGIAYEDVIDRAGKFPLLRPMSEIAGKGGFLAACEFAKSTNGGRGRLYAKLDGLSAPRVTIIGAGCAGIGAAELASGCGNMVSLVDIDYYSLEHAKMKLGPNVEFVMSNQENIERLVKQTDLLINCTLWPKWRTDHLVSRELVRQMKEDAMIVDVSCDEHGAIETCRNTYHSDPTYTEEGVLHYCVGNIPGAYPKDASVALCNATLPYALAIADKGVVRALSEDAGLRRGLCFYQGQLTLEETGRKQNRPYISPEEALGLG